jgi:hypothetical protein
VLTTVNLNNQSFLKADKVYDVRPNGLLTAELVAINLIAAQMLPQLPLSIG